MTRALALALVLVTSSAVAEDKALDVKRAVVTLQDGSVVHVVEGCWITTQQCIGSQKELAALRPENAHLKEHAAELPTAILVAVFVVGVVAGGALTFTFTR